jgi:hypothetical protein
MSVPRDPENLENPEDPEEPAPEGRGDELDVETPEADAAEQRTELRRGGDEEPTGIDRDQADEADVAEQARSAGPDGDDDYR